MDKKSNDPLAAVDPVPKEVKAAAKKAKADGVIPYWVVLNGLGFVYRPIKRSEWKKLSREQNKELIAANDDPITLTDIKERYVEKIVDMCIIWSSVPIDENLGAGYVETLSDAILIDSGFGQPDAPSMEV